VSNHFCACDHRDCDCASDCRDRAAAAAVVAVVSVHDDHDCSVDYCMLLLLLMPSAQVVPVDTRINNAVIDTSG
jgi:hypothetical protein